MANDVAKRAAFKYLFDLITERSKVKKKLKGETTTAFGGWEDLLSDEGYIYLMTVGCLFAKDTMRMVVVVMVLRVGFAGNLLEDKIITAKRKKTRSALACR